jgi:hypothetical protein
MSEDVAAAEDEEEEEEEDRLEDPAAKSSADSKNDDADTIGMRLLVPACGGLCARGKASIVATMKPPRG